MVSEFLPGQPLQHALPPAALNWIAARAGDAGRALGRLAVLRARLGVARQPPPEHVHADRARRRRRVRLQRRRDARARAVSRIVPRCTAAGRACTSSRRRSSSCSCCSARCWSCARAAGPARAIRALLGLAPKTARRIDADGREAGRAARARAGRRSPARAAGREGAGGRRRARRREHGRRIDGHRRADPGREGSRASRSPAARSTAPARS